VSNPGAVPVAIGTVSLQTPGEFLIQRDTCAGETLPVGATCAVYVRFAPTAPGAPTSALEISGPAQPMNAQLSGQASAAPGLVPDLSDIDFGEVPLGKPSRTRRVVLTNQAATPATVANVLVHGPSAAEVTVVATDCNGAVLAPGASCTVDLQLEPAGLGTRSASLTAAADVPAFPASLHALGRGLSVEWIPGALSFGNMNVGVQTPAQDAELRNTGNATLTIDHVEVTGDAADFVLAELTPGITVLHPGGEVGFRIRFKPTAPGDREAFLRIYSDAPGSPHALDLTGVAFSPP
jgi:hypothetical protein